MREFIVIIVTAIGVLIQTLPSYATCNNGAVVANDSYCLFFRRYIRRADATFDPRLFEGDRIPRPKDGEIPLRSIALIVDVNAYPNLSEEKRQLMPAVYDRENIIGFLERQGFDEVILLENQQASRETIDYFIESYIPAQLSLYKQRARTLFAVSAHGVQGDDGTSSSIALSNFSGKNSETKDLYPIVDLSRKLKDNIARRSRHFVAFLANCYSGSAIPIADADGDNIFYPGARGAHIVTAARADELSYAVGQDQGTLFFESLIKGVESGQADRDYAGWVQIDDSNLTLRGGGIVRLGSLAAYISKEVANKGKNPLTNQPFPQLRMGSLLASKDGGGAFFFLGPPKKDEIKITSLNCIGKECSSQANVVSLSASTGSSVVGKPNIAIFDAPDTYKIKGIDVSHHNGVIDWTGLAKAKISFAYIKATQGATFEDDHFRRNLVGAEKAGINRGAYHVFSFCKSAQEQFDNIVRVVPVNMELPIAVDIEWYDGPGMPYEKRCSDLPTIRSHLRELLNKIERRFGRVPVLHAPASGIQQVLTDDFSRFPLWLQYYGKQSSQMAGIEDAAQFALRLPGRNPWTIWQVSQNETVPGVIGNVDTDVFFGNEDQFNRFRSHGFNEALEALPFTDSAFSSYNTDLLLLLQKFETLGNPKALKNAEDVVSSSVTRRLSDGQKSALISLVYNIGANRFLKSKILRDVNLGHDDVVLQDFEGYNTNVYRYPGLMKRRELESKLYSGRS